MHRLLQGEVGTGKTVVALRAMLAVVDSGGQAVLLAPTEVLAVQHHRSLATLLGPLAERGCSGLGRRHPSHAAHRVLGAPARREALLQAASGEAGIIVGMHALLEERFSSPTWVSSSSMSSIGSVSSNALPWRRRVPATLGRTSWS